MARAALLNGTAVPKGGPNSATAKNRTYSRASGPMVPPGQLPQLNSLSIGSRVLDHCGNEAASDSTEEEEADNWDSNVSTTIDRTLTTQQQQNNVTVSGKVNNANSYPSSQGHNGQANLVQQRHRLVNGKCVYTSVFMISI